MTQKTLLPYLFRWFRSGPARKPRAGRGHAAWRATLGVERFEARVVPAALVDNVFGSVVAIERDPIGLVGSGAAIDPAFPGLVDLAAQDPFSSGLVEKVGIVGPTDLPVEKVDIVGPTD